MYARVLGETDTEKGNATWRNTHKTINDDDSVYPGTGKAKTCNQCHEATIYFYFLDFVPILLHVSTLHILTMRLRSQIKFNKAFIRVLSALEFNQTCKT